MNETISRHSWQHVGLNNFFLAMLGAIAFGTLFGFIPSIVTSIIIVLRKIVLSSVWQYFRLFVIGCFVTFFIFVIAFHDINRLNNYKVMEVELFNMFPRTYHVESISLLERKSVEK